MSQKYNIFTTYHIIFSKKDYFPSFLANACHFPFFLNFSQNSGSSSNSNVHHAAPSMLVGNQIYQKLKISLQGSGPFPLKLKK